MDTYAVIDVETTGLSPAHHHRIIEVAIVLLDELGNPVTLINPQAPVLLPPGGFLKAKDTTVVWTDSDSEVAASN